MRATIAISIISIALGSHLIQIPAAAQTLEPGTRLEVRTTRTISTKSCAVGDTFLATLEAPLMNGDREIAAKGADVEGKVTICEKSGRVKGRAAIELELTRVKMREGNWLDVYTSTFDQEASASKKSDAAKVGIGAAAGAVLGAIFGGGKGAAIGAAAGGGAGLGTVLITKGKASEIPAETILVFSLARQTNLP